MLVSYNFAPYILCQKKKKNCSIYIISHSETMNFDGGKQRTKGEKRKKGGLDCPGKK